MTHTVMLTIASLLLILFFPRSPGLALRYQRIATRSGSGCNRCF